MTYEDFIKSKIINNKVDNYELLLEAMLQTSVAPSTYLADKINKRRVSESLKTMFGEQPHKAKNTSFNFYFLREYRENILGIEDHKLKICSACKQELPLERFYSNGYQPSGKKKYKAKCKECQTLQSCERKEKLILNVFGSYSCKVCGYNKCKNALEFHHLDPKIKEHLISDIIKNNSETTVVNELKKCIIVCSNCHREIHYGLHPEYLLE